MPLNRLETYRRMTTNKLPDGFFSRYWQRQHLYLPGFIPGINNPLTPEELAGLACEHDVESRLVHEHSSGNKTQWTNRFGPFSDKDFLSLPAAGWSLLVQSVNHHVPAFREVLASFDFMPAWSFDDIMASYTPGGGSTGPHFDYYDVFILQLDGSREWLLGERCGPESPLLDDCDLALLANFNTREHITLQPGDLLYIPRQMAHWGRGEKSSFSLSIGYRHPSIAELLEKWLEQQLCQLDESHRLDPSQYTPGGLLDGGLLAEIHTRLEAAVDNTDLPALLASLTNCNYPLPAGHDDHTAGALAAALGNTGYLAREEACQALYSMTGDECRVFINGEAFFTGKIPAADLSILCNRVTLTAAEATRYLQQEGDAGSLLLTMFNRGYFYLEQEGQQ